MMMPEVVLIHETTIQVGKEMLQVVLQDDNSSGIGCHYKDPVGDEHHNNLSRKWCRKSSCETTIEGGDERRKWQRKSKTNGEQTVLTIWVSGFLLYSLKDTPLELQNKWADAELQ
jgi:hypothetical protein